MQIISASSNNKIKLIPNTIFFGALLILVSVLPFSEYVISLSQFTIAGAWLLSLNFKEKFQRLYRNKFFWALAGLAAIHLIGIAYTDAGNIKYALKDIRIKVPLLLLPLLFASSKPLTKKQFEIVLQFFVAAIFCATVYSVGIKHGLWGPSSVDARDTSIFISHIRFALMICFSIFILMFFIFSDSFSSSKVEVFVYSLLITWFCFVIYHIPFLTGAILLPFVAILSFFILLYKRCSPFQKLVSISLIVLLPVFALYYLNNLSESIHLNYTEDIESLETTTLEGNLYEHDV
ncbi:MAG: hypothetical protein KJO64_04745, partial [Bacteroidia bacterium]|nr:hypothetical protein [Bacteroidia bacterium]